jgi:hypothetical protein
MASQGKGLGLSLPNFDVAMGKNGGKRPIAFVRGGEIMRVEEIRSRI